MKDTITKGSHFIWRKYLEQFSTNNMLWVYDKKSGKYFQNITDNIAKKKNIYKFDTFFKPLDRAACSEFIKKSFNGENLKKVVGDLICFLENDFQQLLRSLNINEQIISSLKEKEDFIQYLDNQERLYAFYEENFTPILDLLLKEDASFYTRSEDIDLDNVLYSEVYYFEMSMFLKKEIALFLTHLKDTPTELLEIQERIGKEIQKLKEEVFHKLPEVKQFRGNFYFTQFLFSQYGRTYKHLKSIKERLSQLDEYWKKKINIQVLIAFGTHILPHNQTISCNQDRQHIVFLKNTTDLNLITGDQPIINTLADRIENGENRIELYYPISTNLAILFTSGDRYTEKEKIELSKNDVIEWNKLVINEAEHFIYAKNISDLRKSGLIF